MVLKQFKEYFEKFPNGTSFRFGISEPFSWRGVYSEVAFEILETPMSKEEILSNINAAYDGEFEGWKGGTYSYNKNTTIHFEKDYGSYTDGGYLITKFLNLAFSGIENGTKESRDEAD